jgi:hypothetical protein
MEDLAQVLYSNALYILIGLVCTLVVCLFWEQITWAIMLWGLIIAAVGVFGIALNIATHNRWDEPWFPNAMYYVTAGTVLFVIGAAWQLRRDRNPRPYHD